MTKNQSLMKRKFPSNQKRKTEREYVHAWRQVVGKFYLWINFMYVVYSNQIFILQRLSIQGSLIKALPSEITLLQWKDQDTTWIKTITTSMKMLSSSLLWENQTSMWHLSTSLRGMKICGWMGGGVRSLNLQFYLALMRNYTSYWCHWPI